LATKVALVQPALRNTFHYSPHSVTVSVSATIFPRYVFSCSLTYSFYCRHWNQPHFTLC